jgi:hypothetical protein
LLFVSRDSRRPAWLLLPLLLFLSGCAETPQERAWRIAAEREQHRAALIGAALGALAVVVVGVAARRRLTAYGWPALTYLIASAVCGIGVSLVVFTLALPPFVWPRDLFSYRPLSGPSPSDAALGLLLGVLLWGPLVILAMLSWHVSRQLSEGRPTRVTAVVATALNLVVGSAVIVASADLTGASALSLTMAAGLAVLSVAGVAAACRNCLPDVASS